MDAPNRIDPNRQERPAPINHSNLDRISSPGNPIGQNLRINKAAPTQANPTYPTAGQLLRIPVAPPYAILNNAGVIAHGGNTNNLSPPAPTRRNAAVAHHLNRRPPTQAIRAERGAARVTPTAQKAAALNTVAKPANSNISEVSATKTANRLFTKLRSLTQTHSALSDRIDGLQRAHSTLQNKTSITGKLEVFKTLVAAVKTLDSELSSSNLPREQLVASKQVLSDFCSAFDENTPLVEKKFDVYQARSGDLIQANNDSIGQKPWINHYTQQITKLTGISAQPHKTLTREDTLKVANAWLKIATEIESKESGPAYGSARAAIFKQQTEKHGIAGLSLVMEKKAAVCRELSIIGSAVLAEYGISSHVGSGTVDVDTGKPGGHCWIEITDSNDAVAFIVDSNFTRSVSTSFEEYSREARGVSYREDGGARQKVAEYTTHSLSKVLNDHRSSKPARSPEPAAAQAPAATQNSSDRPGRVEWQNRVYRPFS